MKAAHSVIHAIFAVVMSFKGVISIIEYINEKCARENTPV